MIVAKVGKSSNKKFLVFVPLNEKCVIQVQTNDKSYFPHLCYENLDYRGLKFF